jgi:hypothetical protein
MDWEWKRLGKDVVNEQASEREETNLRVGFVALLHNLGSIDQDRDTIGLPDITTVQSNLESLLSLSAWFNYLNSKRFTFPRLHISKLNDNAALQTVHDYLDACWQKKKDYEAGKNDVEERERLNEAERAIVAIRNSFYKPNSKKHLWKWIHGILPTKWKNDAWLGAIFVGNNADIANWEFDELELFEEIIQSSLPLEYSTINHAVRERINEVKAAWKEHYETFTIEEDGKEYIASLTEELANTPEPKQSDYPSKADFFRAKAKWQLAHPSSYTKKIDQQIENARTKLGDQL